MRDLYARPEHLPPYVRPFWRQSPPLIVAELAQGLQPPPLQAAATDVAITCRPLFIEMRDGTRLAADLFRPAASDAPTPVVIVTTRYWRAAASDNAANRAAAVEWARNGFALLVVDARGSGASFGTRRYDWSDEELADYGEVVQWAAVQDWCDGRVVTEGASYGGNAAELAARHPGLFAAIPRYTDFDPYTDLLFPGGVPNLFMSTVWAAMTRAMDQNDVAIVAALRGAEAASGPKPVAADLLQAALDEHRDNGNVGDFALAVECKDDPICSAPAALFSSLGIAPHLHEVAATNVPQLAFASWTDAGTAAGLLKRFVLAPELPLHATIGAWSHGTRAAGDPFGKLAVPSLAQQIESYAAALRAPIRRALRYYTMGADRWQETTSWPPAHLRDERWFLAPSGSLTQSAPTQAGVDHYEVDPSCSTGRRNRWYSQVGGGEVAYGDRRDEDRKLLCYDSAPLQQRLEITGVPVLQLEFASDQDDACIFVYLEQVAPDGTVTCLTEGQFRAAHRKRLEPSPLPACFGPQHSFLRDDMQKLVPGERSSIAFALLPLSVELEAGCRLRLAIAGADRDTFASFDGRWTIAHGSTLDLPVCWR